nr:DUF5134 domain-containing protein [Actinomycetospora corticicola]
MIATGDHGGSRVAELAHLLMSLAMLAMTWGVTGGPTTPGAVLQILVFTVLTAWFVRRVLLPPPGHRRLVEGYHAAMCAAMVWMVAAMPQIMGTSMSGDGGGGHHHGGSGPVATMVPVVTPGWVTGLTWAFAVVSLAAAASWLLRVVRPVVGRGCGPVPGGVPDAGSGPVAVATRPAVMSVRAAIAPRLDAGCHLLMSAGMAVMLLVM